MPNQSRAARVLLVPVLEVEPMRVRAAILVVAYLATLTLSACGGSDYGSAQTVTVDENANGHSVQVPPGASVAVELHNTFGSSTRSATPVCS